MGKRPGEYMDQPSTRKDLSKVHIGAVFLPLGNAGWLQVVGLAQNISALFEVLGNELKEQWHVTM